MISTIPFRRTGRAALFGPRVAWSPHMRARRAVRRHRLKDNRSAERRHRRICWPDETRAADGRHLVDPGGGEHRRLDPHDDQPHRAGQTSRACTHFASRSPSIGAAIGGGRPRPSAGRRRRVRSPAGTRRRQRPDSPDPSTDSNGGARRLGSEEPVCKLSRALPSSHAAENHAVRCTRRRPVWAISDTPRITGKLVQGRRKRRSGPGRIRGGGWT